MRPISDEVKKEAVRLRLEEQLGLLEISKRLSVSKATLSVLLRPYPLPPELIQARNRANGAATKGNADRGNRRCHLRGMEGGTRTGPPPWLVKALANSKIDRRAIGLIAETSALLRLRVHGFAIFSPDEGAREDWVVRTPGTSKLLAIQVKAVGRVSAGLPSISLCRNRYHSGLGARSVRYSQGDFDFIVGYDIQTDICYVWSWAEVEHRKRSIAITPDAAERWDKLFSV